MKDGEKEICSDCKGVIYPFERDNTTSCLCVPADYEQCAECGFDHEYDPAEAAHAHQLIAWDKEEREAARKSGRAEE